MASTEGSMVAVGAPWVDCRGGRGGGCPLYLASRWVATAPCADDVIFTCRNVSGGANEYVVTIHEGDEVIAHQQSGSRYICSRGASWPDCRFATMEGQCEAGKELAAWTARAR